MNGYEKCGTCAGCPQRAPEIRSGECLDYRGIMFEFIEYGRKLSFGEREGFVDIATGKLKPDPRSHEDNSESVEYVLSVIKGGKGAKQ